MASVRLGCSMMEVSALMVPSEVLVDPVVDLVVCCKVNSVVVPPVVLVKVEDVVVKVVFIYRARRSRRANQYS